MLLDTHILYPDFLQPEDVVGKIKAVLSRAHSNNEVWTDPKMKWENFIFRASFEWGINPAWLLIGLQRERSLFGQEGDEKDFNFAEGFVGKDGPGTVNERWDGLPTQLFLAARGTAWLACRGFNFGWRGGIAPSVPRWRVGSHNQIMLLGDDHQETGMHECETMAEFVQLSYTPHLKVLDVNHSILEQWAPEFL